MIIHTVKKGETLYNIAKKYGINFNALLAANSSIRNPALIQPGQVINIPRPAVQRTIVIPRESYGYNEMLNDLQSLEELYPFIEVNSIGSTVMGRSIPAVKLGHGKKEVHYNGSFHANEWITTVLLMKFIENYAKAYASGKKIGSFNIQGLFDTTSLWIVPMVNPDGVQLVQGKIATNTKAYQTALMINSGSRDFRGWKANIRGVDLNDQFPAHWETEVSRRAASAPSPQNYPGNAPLSEPESRAIAEFTRSHNFRLVSAFHTQGEEIYWGYRGLEPNESQLIVTRLVEVSGYEAVRYVESDAGYKDWFIQDWRRPGFTVECGLGVNPLPIAQFWDIWGKVIGIFLMGIYV
ncbi:M14 family zinc carboxypeptidase [Desulfosporosinus meridiei]|uniref:Putative carboxypeptidase n=1 Tax=Desulfosporosinus meridiei (strain ATCC BAA-275 / DSM 13257 / KCTC 12902 / NCIMB 13706 / S10) TaxID=768704 RepID=J7IU02_DESMD|nr:M14 family zinc carboxypeptidase [Desulfosporosinus meridiei]AFQ43649.1 putative carboxypeptidase [Desulfosporosinus meridiei DSM 13257]